MAMDRGWNSVIGLLSQACPQAASMTNDDGESPIDAGLKYGGRIDADSLLALLHNAPDCIRGSKTLQGKALLPLVLSHVRTGNLVTLVEHLLRQDQQRQV